jgi:molybdopterin-binding protein
MSELINAFAEWSGGYGEVSWDRDANILQANREASTLPPLSQEKSRMKVSARNVLKGKVKQITPGAVNTEVIIELPGGTEVVSVITKHSAEHLALTQGKDVYAVIKASNVMVMTD